MTYFHWLLDKVNLDKHTVESYHDLLEALYDRIFYAKHPDDNNRISDALSLRHQYMNQNRTSFADGRDVSVLEIMVSLALRMEDIMTDMEQGDRTENWFMYMIASLGLYHMRYGSFNRLIFDDVMHRFLEREYSELGIGGLFALDNPPTDMRTAGIWCQANWYLSSFS